MLIFPPVLFALSVGWCPYSFLLARQKTDVYGGHDGEQGRGFSCVWFFGFIWFRLKEIKEAVSLEFVPHLPGIHLLSQSSSPSASLVYVPSPLTPTQCNTNQNNWLQGRLTMRFELINFWWRTLSANWQTHRLPQFLDVIESVFDILSWTDSYIEGWSYFFFFF